MFSPTRSIIRQKFWRGAEWLKVAPVVEDNWDACLQTLEGRLNRIEAICFSPDGKLLASASEDEIRLWDARTGVTHSVIRDDLNFVTAIAVSPHNRFIGSAHTDGTIKLRDLGTQEVCKTFTRHSEWVNAIMFLSNGELLASTFDDHTVNLWNTATGLTLSLPRGRTYSAKVLAASQHGKLVASGSTDRTICLWDVEAEKLRCVLKGHWTSVQAVTFMHDYTIIASADAAGCINFWEASTGALRNKLDTRTKAYKSTFSPDGKLLAVVEKGDLIKFFDTVTGSLQSVLVGHGESVSDIEFSPDGTVLASGSFRGTVKLWDIPTAFNHNIVETSEVFDIAISPRGIFVTSYLADSIKLWNAHTGYLELEGFTIALNQNEDMVACALHNHTINLQNLKTGASNFTLDDHTGIVSTLAFSPDDKLLASASQDQSVNLWDVETGALCRKFSCTHEILEVVFSPNGKLLAIVLGRDIVELWNIATETPCWTLHAPEGLENVVFSPDGMLLASKSCPDGIWTTAIWNTTTTDRIQLDNHESFGKTCAFSPSGRLVVFVSEDGILKLWDVVSGAVNDMLGGANGDGTMVAFSPDEKLIASATYSIINLWDAESRTLIEMIAVDSDGPSIVSVSFSPDGRYIKSNLGYHRIQTNDHSCSDDCFYLLIRGNWIYFGSSPFLWLPTDFRAWQLRECSVGIATIAVVRPYSHPLIMTFDMTELERLFS